LGGGRDDSGVSQYIKGDAEGQKLRNKNSLGMKEGKESSKHQRNTRKRGGGGGTVSLGEERKERINPSLNSKKDALVFMGCK